MALTPDGRQAVSASHDQTVKVWDQDSGKTIATFQCEAGIGSCLCASGGKVLVIGDQGAIVHFLRLEGQPV